jgi:hypothetical protein
MRHLIITIATAAALALLAACGSQGTTTGTAAAVDASAPAQSCHAQFEAWRNGAARPAGKAVAAKFRAVQAAGSAADIPRLVNALKAAGHGVTALQAYPMPRCADPHGYWPAILTRIRSAADNAGTGSGLGALMLAMVPLKQIPALERKLSAELKRAVGASKAFS